MKESQLTFDGNSSATKVFSVGDTFIETDHINHGDLFESDGNAAIGAKIDTASITLKVYCKLKLGKEIGYGPYHELKDESDTRVATFDSTKIFQASLYNQQWFTRNHLGFILKFTVESGSISGGEILICEVQTS